MEIDKGGSRTKVALVSCGSFNPITNMHLRMFERARDHLHSTGKYEVVQGIISPVHDSYEKPGLEKALHRVKMCEMALETSEWVSVDSWEASQETWSTTLSVLEHFDLLLNQIHLTSAEKKGKKQGYLFAAGDEVVKVRLLCGGDLLESFAKPGLWRADDIEKVVGKFGMVVIRRTATNAEKLIYEHDVVYLNRRNIDIVTEWFANDISSTKVRDAIRRNESIKYVVQEPVIQYIEKHDLYRTK